MCVPEADEVGERSLSLRRDGPAGVNEVTIGADGKKPASVEELTLNIRTIGQLPSLLYILDCDVDFVGKSASQRDALFRATERMSL
jgi:hypothetical protein